MWDHDHRGQLEQRRFGRRLLLEDVERGALDVAAAVDMAPLIDVLQAMQHIAKHPLTES